MQFHHIFSIRVLHFTNIYYGNIYAIQKPKMKNFTDDAGAESMLVYGLHLIKWREKKRKHTHTPYINELSHTHSHMNCLKLKRRELNSTKQRRTAAANESGAHYGVEQYEWMHAEQNIPEEKCVLGVYGEVCFCDLYGVYCYVCRLIYEMSESVEWVFVFAFTDTIRVVLTWIGDVLYLMKSTCTTEYNKTQKRTAMKN